jgi:isopentenyl-diphosphate delta-isomerase
MAKVTQISSRKTDHIRINLEEDVQSHISTGLEHYQFTHCALPELNLEDIDLSLSLFGKWLKGPLLISSMTGGTPEAQEINQTLARAAQEAQIAIGVGSMRAAIEHPELLSSFQIRRYAPDVLLFANLGAIQLNYGYSIKECLRAVEMIEADALILHFNALQEAVQPEGDTRFAGLLAKVETICHAMPVPVIAKEVGWGFSEKDVASLANAGVSAIDVAGAGGTSWSQVEAHRTTDEEQQRLATAFINWGIPTAEAIQIAHKTAPQMILFASGGLRSGIDIAKCIALGADLGGMASPFLKAAALSLEKTLKTIEVTRKEIQICMFAAGIRNLSQLKEYTLRYS